MNSELYQKKTVISNQKDSRSHRTSHGRFHGTADAGVVATMGLMAAAAGIVLSKKR